jgi:hypothetical protein
LPDDDAVEQIVDRHLLADVDEHFRAAHAPGFFADGDLFVFLQFAALDFQSGDVGRHQLGQAGGRQALVAQLVDQNGPAGSIHQYVGFGGEGRRWRGNLRAPCRGDDQQGEQQYQALQEIRGHHRCRNHVKGIFEG